MEDKVLSGLVWDEIEAEPKSKHIPSSAQIDLSQLPLTTNENGDKVSLNSFKTTF